MTRETILITAATGNAVVCFIGLILLLNIIKQEWGSKAYNLRIFQYGYLALIICTIGATGVQINNMMIYPENINNVDKVPILIRYFVGLNVIPYYKYYLTKRKLQQKEHGTVRTD